MTKKIILLIVCMLAAIGSHGQETEIDSTKVEGWKKSGHTSLMVNQTAFSNWVSGGENSIATIFLFLLFFLVKPWTKRK